MLTKQEKQKVNSEILDIEEKVKLIREIVMLDADNPRRIKHKKMLTDEYMSQLEYKMKKIKKELKMV